MRYLKRYAKARVWLTDHPKAHVCIQYSPLAVFLLVGRLVEKDVIWDETAHVLFFGLAAAWFVLWVTHRVLLRLDMKRMENPEQ
jgi:hypothetical protein